jgi:hypothetical protein
VVERVEPAVVGPRERGGVQTLVGHVAGVNLAHERQGPVQVRVPRDGADRGGGRRGKGRARASEGLHSTRQDLVTCYPR